MERKVSHLDHFWEQDGEMVIFVSSGICRADGWNDGAGDGVAGLDRGLVALSSGCLAWFCSL